MINQEEFDRMWRNAKQIALVAHHQQMRGDEPYVNHPMRVAHSCIAIWNDPYATVGGLLHDVLEDSAYNEDTLLMCSIPEEVINVVKLVTCKSNTSRKDYINNLLESGNVSALRVKLMDAIDNSTWTYREEIVYRQKDWASKRIYYRELATKLWEHYLQAHQDDHAPDEDHDFFKRVIHRWNELDNLSRRLMAGEVVTDDELNVRMLTVIEDINYPMSDEWTVEL